MTKSTESHFSRIDICQRLNEPVGYDIHPTKDSFPTVDHDHIQQCTVNFNPVDLGYVCHVTI